MCGPGKLNEGSRLSAGSSKEHSPGSAAIAAWHEIRALRHDGCCIRLPRYDPHHAQVARCKRFLINPNFSDGFLEMLCRTA
ncbi:MAG: hypothetical protein QOJ42_7924 [Acidobacteriaceae bacterium]|nr:hypothetical protein [Acidobacteriaceae bacterium]